MSAALQYVNEFVDIAACHRQLREAVKPLRLHPPTPHGPVGHRWAASHNGTELMSFIVSAARHGDHPLDDGPVWIHASVATVEHLGEPTYTMLTVLHRAVFGDRYAIQVFAPPSDHVNIHPNALHLWGRADGTRCHPEFGALGTI